MFLDVVLTILVAAGIVIGGMVASVLLAALVMTASQWDSDRYWMDYYRKQDELRGKHE